MLIYIGVYITKETDIMKRFEKILIATDLDGTLLRQDKSISDENLRAIEYFKDNGGIFTFITGRIPPGAKKVYEKIKPNAPFGCMNGGGIYDYIKKEMIWSIPIDLSALELVKYVEENMPGMGIKLAATEKTYCHKQNAYTERHRREEGLDEIFMHYKDVTDTVAKILFADEPRNIDELAKILAGHPMAKNFNILRSDEIYYEILPRNSSKGNLLTKLAEILEVDMQNTIAIGDNDNDISMLKTAGKGYAVSNASQGAKEAADIITVSNEEHAIAKIIEDLDKRL